MDEIKIIDSGSGGRKRYTSNIPDIDGKATKERLIEAIEIYDLHIGKACQSLGVHRTLHNYYLENDEWYAAQIASLWEAKVDDVEGALVHTAMKDRNVFAQKVFLSARARNRGYAEERLPKGSTNGQTQTDYPKLEILHFNATQQADVREKREERMRDAAAGT